MEFELDAALAGQLVAVAGLRGRVESVEQLTGGISSAVFGVRAGGHDVVVKIYPDTARQSMRKELWVSRFLLQHAPALPVPNVLAADDSRSLVPHDFAVLTRLPGRNLRSLLPRLSEPELVAVNRRIGATLRLLHDVEPQAFGELGSTSGGRGYRTNRDYMVCRFDERLREFARLGGEPQLREHLVTYVHAREELLDRCGRPAFCHNDGHDANVLVVPSPGGWSLSGLLDFENALAGDPLLDLAKTHYFSERRNDRTLAALADGYGHLDDGWRATFDLYVIYHRLELWNLLASLGVAERLPTIAAELRRST